MQAMVYSILFVNFNALSLSVIFILYWNIKIPTLNNGSINYNIFNSHYLQ